MFRATLNAMVPHPETRSIYGTPEKSDTETTDVPAVARALDVLELLAASPDPLTLAQITNLLGLPKGSAHRLLATLRGRGYVAFSGDFVPPSDTRRGGGYVLGPQTARLAPRQNAPPDLTDASRLPMQTLARETGEGCQISVRVGSVAVCVGRVASPLHPDISLMGNVGARFPLHGVAVGKVLLAFAPPSEQAAYLENALPAWTPRTQTDVAALKAELDALCAGGQNAVARDAEEYKRGLCALAAPIWDAGGVVCAALGLPYLAGDANEANRYAAALTRAAHAASQTLGFAGASNK